MNTPTIIVPMRPALDLGAAMQRSWRHPGWGWQVKLNEERAVFRLFDRTLFNRHRQLFDIYKARHFAQAMEALESFAGADWVDVGMIGVRDTAAFSGMKGAIVVYDVPSDAPWEVRYRTITTKLPPIDLLAGEKFEPGMIYCLPQEDMAGELFHRTKGVPGVEGVVGRNLQAPYIYGESIQMAKAKWKK